MLLGKPDAELMKEDVAAAVDTSKSEDERIAALDHLEMVRTRSLLAELV
jgi:hypothetical protein